MRGVEFLRSIHAGNGHGIKPKTQISKMEMLKEAARAWGLDPEKILTKEAQAFPRRSYVSPLERRAVDSKTLSKALRDAVKRDLQSVTQ